MTTDTRPTSSTYAYSDLHRDDLIGMVPADGKIIGSVGCGTGMFESSLARLGRELHGVDISEEAIAIARPRLASARVIDVGDRQPFAPASLDGLILADVLEHIPLARELLAGYVAALRPGGWVLISVPTMRSIRVLWRFGVHGDWPEQSTGLFDATHVQMMSRHRLDRWLRSVGMVPERWDTNLLILPRLGALPFRIANVVTLGLLREWMSLQVKVVARKPK